MVETWPGGVIMEFDLNFFFVTYVSAMVVPCSLMNGFHFLQFFHCLMRDVNLCTCVYVRANVVKIVPPI